MGALKSLYQQGLSARVEALGAAERGLERHEPEAIETVRRITHSLYFSRDTYDNPEATKAILALEKANDEELPAHLRSLLPKLRDLTSAVNAKRVTILIVDDDPFSSENLKRKLAGPRRSIHVAKNVAEADKVIEEKDVDIVLLDIMLPDSDGRDLLVRLRERFPAPSLPILVISGKDAPEVQAECFALGADAYFQKPVDIVTLSTAISSYLQRTADYTRGSARDPLTELPNREGFSQAFARASSLASLAFREREPLSVAIIDIDRFKSVNDLYGHSTGDAVLQKASAVISASLRASDLLARWGGEEFVVLLPHTDLSSARLALGKALKSLRAERFESKAGQPFGVTFSGGVTQVKPGESMEKVLIEADRLLFRAKALGRNQIVTASDVLTEPKRKVLVMSSDEPAVSDVQGLLERIEMTVLHASDPEGALSVASKAAVCLIVLDVDASAFDGFEFLKSLRKNPAFAQVPIVVLTGRKGQFEVVKAFQLGADDCVQKPIVPQELSARILRLLK
jgi:two-component system, cell cycle response regulator